MTAHEQTCASAPDRVSLRERVAQSTLSLQLRGRLHENGEWPRRSSLVQELASALALIDMADGLDPALRRTLVDIAAQRIHAAATRLEGNSDTLG